MTVKDIMRCPARTIQDHASLCEAVDLLWTSQVSGLPVVSNGNELVGIVTEQDIIRTLLPTYCDIAAADGAIQGGALLEGRVSEVRYGPVSSIMTRQVSTLSEDDSVLTAASMMILRRLKVVPVTRGNTVIGTVSRIDVLHSLV